MQIAAYMLARNRRYTVLNSMPLEIFAHHQEHMRRGRSQSIPYLRQIPANCCKKSSHCTFKKNAGTPWVLCCLLRAAWENSTLETSRCRKVSHLPSDRAQRTKIPARFAYSNSWLRTKTEADSARHCFSRKDGTAIGYLVHFSIPLLCFCVLLPHKFQDMPAWEPTSFRAGEEPDGQRNGAIDVITGSTTARAPCRRNLYAHWGRKRSFLLWSPKRW